jgi:hypothetical protein
VRELEKRRKGKRAELSRTELARTELSRTGEISKEWRSGPTTFAKKTHKKRNALAQWRRTAVKMLWCQDEVEL